MDETNIDAAAARLLRAIDVRTPCAPVRDLIGQDDLDVAYRVQKRMIEARVHQGSRVVGRKIGLTSRAVQEQLGVDQPDFGVLLDDMAYGENELIPMARLLQPKAETEVAFVLGQSLVDGPLDAAQVRGAVDHVVAALEIVDSRIADWDITFSDTVADNASSGLFVLGSERRTVDEVDLVQVTMSMTIDGVEVSTGNGAACLGDPLNALAWLAVKARDLGEPLRAGQVILSGALGPMREVAPGSVVVGRIEGLGSVTARFATDVDARETA